MSLDYEHEIGNGWNEYQRLILTEMKRLADQGEEAAKHLQQIEVHNAQVGQILEGWAKLSGERQKKIESLERRVMALELIATNTKAKHSALRSLASVGAWIVSTVIAGLVMFFTAQHVHH